MKYNSIKKVCLLLAFSSALVSCSDFLDKRPENSVPTEDVDYTNLSEMYKPVSGIYGVTRRKLSFWGALGLISVRGDDVNKGSNPNDQIEFQYCKEFSYAKIKGYWALNGMWEGLYNVVSSSNAALEALDNYGLHVTSEADRNRLTAYKAEVRFLRAFAFFRITQLWGDAPLMIDNKALNLKLTDKETLRRFIQTELDDCAKQLPDARPNELADKPGAVTRYSALALKAKLALLDGDFNTVKTTTNEIIASKKFALYNDFYQLFKIPGKLSNESLFELQFTDFGTGSGEVVTSDAWFAFQGPRGNDNPVQGWGFMVPSQALKAFMAERGEKVRQVTTLLWTNAKTPSDDFIKPGQPGEPDCYNGKVYTPANQMTPGRVEYGMNNNIRMIRYADVLLMNAEAKVRLGESGDVPFNEVRRRAEMPELTQVTVDQILDERRAELAMEWGERFFDLVRTGKAASVLPGFKAGDEFYPIPQNQVDLNPNLAK
ncbi:MAG: RagB/SusD family nutrient uptake outer membrane protein [Bacteroidia bacterium]|nr:RagB/SusD family nutrient uptake outer membrane protein [Bacteroidia bacterium]